MIIPSPWPKLMPLQTVMLPTNSMSLAIQLLKSFGRAKNLNIKDLGKNMVRADDCMNDSLCSIFFVSLVFCILF